MAVRGGGDEGRGPRRPPPLIQDVPRPWPRPGGPPGEDGLWPLKDRLEGGGSSPLFECPRVQGFIDGLWPLKDRQGPVCRPRRPPQGPSRTVEDPQGPSRTLKDVEDRVSSSTPPSRLSALNSTTVPSAPGAVCARTGWGYRVVAPLATLACTMSGLCVCVSPTHTHTPAEGCLCVCVCLSLSLTHTPRLRGCSCVCVPPTNTLDEGDKRGHVAVGSSTTRPGPSPPPPPPPPPLWPNF